MDEQQLAQPESAYDKNLRLLKIKAKISFGMAAMAAGVSLAVVTNMDKGDAFSLLGKTDAIVAQAVQKDPKLDVFKFRAETEAALKGQEDNLRLYIAFVCVFLGMRMNKSGQAYNKALENKPR